MIKTLRMKNYRKHTDRTINFTSGINAIRAAVEQGKSTSIEALVYAFFGAKALPQTLDEVVTYGLPASKLRVEVDFTYLGIDYSLYRAKSGAEITFGKERIIGQTETVRFIERLFGTTAAMAGQLMLAPQGELRGALEEGPAGAGRMIEALANFDLLDQIKALVEERLPYGKTDSLIARIEMVREAAATEPADLTVLQGAVVTATTALAAAEEAAAAKQADLNNLDVEAAREILADRDRLTRVIAEHDAKGAELRAALDKETVAAPDPAEIERLRAAVAAEKDVASALALKAELVRLPEPAQWDQDLASLEAEILKVTGEGLELSALLGAVREGVALSEKQFAQAKAVHLLARQKLEHQLIKEETCGLCGKDLKDVPEVAAINNPLTKRIADLDAAWQEGEAANQQQILDDVGEARELEQRLAASNGYLADLVAVQAAHAKCEVLFARAERYIELDRSVVPARWKWIGPEAGGVSQAPKLRALEDQAELAIAEAARRGEQSRLFNQLREERVAAAAALDELPLKDAEETLELAAAARAALLPLQVDVEAKRLDLAGAKQALAVAQGQEEVAARQRAQARAQLTSMEAERDEMAANNVLVKKIVAARPAITDRMWNMVLAAASKYFSEMRGTPATVTRTDGAFMCSAEPMKGLSGSTKDILGLALRVALTRTFLPTVPFLILDEPAAACDDHRESAMLGLLATLGFDQVILVTHSEIADSNCHNLITL